MHFSRTIVSWLLLVAALIAGVPACGFAWCLEGDGSLRVEATGPEGACLDAAGSSAAATPITRTALRLAPPPGPCVVLASAQWEFVSNPDGEGSGESVAVARFAAAVWYLALSQPQVDTPRKEFRGGDDHGASSDTVLIRETVALLI